MLHLSKQHQAQQLELERQYNAMREANEVLRVNAGDGGYLFRRGMNKGGIFGPGAWPIERRIMTEWPSRQGWDHEWKRA
jgi:large subunit ribosomal protein L40